MNRGKNIVALDAIGPEAGNDEAQLNEAQGGAAPLAEAALEEATEVPLPARWRSLVLPALAFLAIASWTATFFWSKREALLSAPGLDQAIDWFASWSGPVLLICVFWLLTMRNSHREVSRFGETARMLGQESNLLSARLSSVNSELSLARNFIEAQARDLEALGRVAVERLSQNAGQLQELVQTNSAQIEAIGSVSSAALENMEKLRGQLPVIANSARDVTNNIGNAGRTAHAQLQEMIAGFKRLNEFGQASERQVEVLRNAVGEVLEELGARSDQLETNVSQRFSDISAKETALRSDLSEYEVQAFAALKAQNEACAIMIAAAQTDLAEQEARGLSAFRERIDLLTAESAGLAEALGSNEQAALERFSAKLAVLDSEIDVRQQRQMELVESMTSRSAALGSQVEIFAEQVGAAIANAEMAEQRLSKGAEQLAANITTGRAALNGADAEIATLTDASVRLLELIQAGSQHSREYIPAALAEAEGRLSDIENRIAAMRDSARDVAGLGETLRETMRESQESIAASTTSLETLHSRMSDQAEGQGSALAEIGQALALFEAQSSGLVKRINAELSASIDKAIAERSDAIAAPIEQASLRAAELARETTVQLRDQLAKVDELAGNLERRVSHARERAEEKVENDFARRVALITESLNSNAIDISRAIDSEVSDLAWAAYLKGDRGIFTRRAVSLINSAEAKAIVQTYQKDDHFHDLVNHYIHDFEAMLRQLLSTRDGNALGVTLLSSDMGKLYVALAQAIERLRR